MEKVGGERMGVTTSTIDETLLVTIDRPPVNALDLETITALEAAFADAAHQSPRNGVVLTGGGQVFSAGVDTRAFAAYGRDRRHDMVRAITRMVAELLAIPVPVVAAINGHALGGGFVLMLSCDYRVATVRSCKARDDRSEGRHSLSGRSAGRDAARACARAVAPPELTSAVLGTRELKEAGVIDALCAMDEVMSRAIADAVRLAAQPAFRAVKRQIRGQLAERVAELAATGQDAFLDAFD
jgi:enoyl-CoA hydratase